MNGLNCFRKDYINYRLMKILLTSDLLITRAAVGLSSILFSMVVSVHYLLTPNFYDLFWVLFSMIHGLITYWALITDRTTKYTFVVEALAGFILWNYTSLSLFLENGMIEAGYNIVGAAATPTFVIGLATWWILSRYPRINTKTSQDTKCRSKKQ